MSDEPVDNICLNGFRGGDISSTRSGIAGFSFCDAAAVQAGGILGINSKCLGEIAGRLMIVAELQLNISAALVAAFTRVKVQ